MFSNAEFPESWTLYPSAFVTEFQLEVKVFVPIKVLNKLVGIF